MLKGTLGEWKDRIKQVIGEHPTWDEEEIAENECGLRRREAEGKPVADMTPVCTVMIGRLDDWLQVVAKRDTIVVDPGALHWAGIAVMKKAYRLYQERGYRTRLLAAAYRHHMH